jgi:wyosine [tRNA(Phe)-imidazoG37] synthetase (radical SAM superfamily)
MTYSYLFGPVPSRRLGLSLGIDLIPYKTCSLDCIYCECGATNKLTLERKEYYPTESILKELAHYLKNEYPKNPPDYFTFSGSGEPTLASNLGTILDFINAKNLNTKTALLTNASLLWDEKVREELLSLDLIVPSLDAALEESFQKINRPVPGLNLGKIINGLIDLRKEFPGKIWLEIFIVPGVNTSKEELKQFKEIIDAIRPDKVQLNSLDRPGTVSGLTKAPKSLLEEIIRFWDLENAEIVASYKYSGKTLNADQQSLREKILETIRRRPCTSVDLAESLGANQLEVLKILDTMKDEGKVSAQVEDRGIFYFYEPDGE